MGIKKRKYSQEFKEEIVQRALSGEKDPGIRKRA